MLGASGLYTSVSYVSGEQREDTLKWFDGEANYSDGFFKTCIYTSSSLYYIKFVKTYTTNHYRKERVAAEPGEVRSESQR